MIPDWVYLIITLFGFFYADRRVAQFISSIKHFRVAYLKFWEAAWTELITLKDEQTHSMIEKRARELLAEVLQKDKKDVPEEIQK